MTVRQNRVECRPEDPRAAAEVPGHVVAARVVQAREIGRAQHLRRFVLRRCRLLGGRALGRGVGRGARLGLARLGLLELAREARAPRRRGLDVRGEPGGVVLVLRAVADEEVAPGDPRGRVDLRGLRRHVRRPALALFEPVAPVVLRREAEAPRPRRRGVVGQPGALAPRHGRPVPVLEALAAHAQPQLRHRRLVELLRVIRVRRAAERRAAALVPRRGDEGARGGEERPLPHDGSHRLASCSSKGLR